MPTNTKIHAQTKAKAPIATPLISATTNKQPKMPKNKDPEVKNNSPAWVWNLYYRLPTTKDKALEVFLKGIDHLLDANKY